MKVVLWYLFVVLATIFLVVAIIESNLLLGACSFVMAYMLSKFLDEIPLPKAYTKTQKVSPKEMRELIAKADKEKAKEKEEAKKKAKAEKKAQKAAAKAGEAEVVTDSAENEE